MKKKRKNKKNNFLFKITFVLIFLLLLFTAILINLKNSQKITEGENKMSLQIGWFKLNLDTNNNTPNDNNTENFRPCPSISQTTNRSNGQKIAFNQYENNGNNNSHAPGGINPDSNNKGQLPQPSITNPCISQTPTPTLIPGQRPLCSHDTGQIIDPNTCECIALITYCENGTCKEARDQRNRSGRENYCGNIDGPHGPCFGKQNGWYCFGKPIIYLYPTTPTLIDVSIKTSGIIFVSDPLYPEGGWKNILAYPSGKLIYENKEYKQLFYESNISNLEKPIYGLTINSNNLTQELSNIITKLGLIKNEKEEFLSFWVPRLKAFNSPYIFFSIIPEKEKERTDSVIISPKPDTFIGFIAYFKPLQFPFQGPELNLPKNPPKRYGFTAVEWGGTIDDNNSLKFY